MGKKDVVSKIYLGAADRIADLLNNELFEGGDAVAVSDIMELDSTAASTLKAEDNIVNVRVIAKDLVRKVRFGMQVMLFAIEEQSDIHYAMPLKVLNGDAGLYDKQWNGIRREHKRKKDLSGAEYISGFGREDHLIPGTQCSIIFRRAGVGWATLSEGDDESQYPSGRSEGKDCGLSRPPDRCTEISSCGTFPHRPQAGVRIPAARVGTRRTYRIY